MKVKFNLNDEIKVKILPGGEKYWNEYWSCLKQYNVKMPTIERDSDGFTKMQIHCFARMFGPYLHLQYDEQPIDMRAEFA